MANNYLQPVNNHFDLSDDDKLEDVEDDIFLSNSRSNSSSSGRYVAADGTASQYSSNNPFAEQQQKLAQRRKEIEQRTLESSQKSLGLLYETEEVGKATAVELAKQREQLERTSRNLEEINSTLRFSQRHLNGLKSVFGGLKNYLAGGNREAPQSPRFTASPSDSRISEGQAAGGMSPSMSNGYGYESRSATMSPITERNYAASTNPFDGASFASSSNSSRERRQQHTQQVQLQGSQNPFETRLEANLEEMCGNLTRLKFLATDLGTEIQSQNELLDNMNYKIEDVDLKVNKQNKEMNKLLGRK